MPAATHPALTLSRLQLLPDTLFYKSASRLRGELLIFGLLLTISLLLFRGSLVGFGGVFRRADRHIFRGCALRFNRRLCQCGSNAER